MKFLTLLCGWFALSSALSIKREVDTDLVARENEQSKLQAAKSILGTISKISGSNDKQGDASDCDDGDSSESGVLQPPQPAGTPTPAPVPAKTSLKEKVKQYVKGKLGALFDKVKALVTSKVKEKVLKKMNKNGVAKREEVEVEQVELHPRTLVEDAMTQVFVALKRSGLINYVIRLSLTDDEVRAGVADITIELIRADVIPYSEVFNALRESGLALDVVKFSLTDAETRQGLIELVLELVPQLVEVCTPAVVANGDFSSMAPALRAREVSAVF